MSEQLLPEGFYEDGLLSPTVYCHGYETFMKVAGKSLPVGSIMAMSDDTRNILKFDGPEPKDSVLELVDIEENYPDPDIRRFLVIKYDLAGIGKGGVGHYRADTAGYASEFFEKKIERLSNHETLVEKIWRRLGHEDLAKIRTCGIGGLIANGDDIFVRLVKKGKLPSDSFIILGDGTANCVYRVFDQNALLEYVRTESGPDIAGRYRGENIYDAGFLGGKGWRVLHPREERKIHIQSELYAKG